jgi:L-threonylcarbamoyladenylate synthase
VGVESTIVDCTGARPRVLRPGAIGAADLDRTWEGHERLPQPTAAQEVRVPGSLAAHYAPRARLISVPADAIARLIGELAAEGGAGRRCGLLAEQSVPDVTGWVRLASPSDAAEYAAALYSSLRRADTMGLDLIVAVPPGADEPLARAVRDRLARAVVGSGR